MWRLVTFTDKICVSSVSRRFDDLSRRDRGDPDKTSYHQSINTEN